MDTSNFKPDEKGLQQRANTRGTFQAFSGVVTEVQKIMIYTVDATSAAYEGFRQFLTLIYKYYEEMTNPLIICQCLSVVVNLQADFMLGYDVLH